MRHIFLQIIVVKYKCSPPLITAKVFIYYMGSIMKMSRPFCTIFFALLITFILLPITIAMNVFVDLIECLFRLPFLLSYWIAGVNTANLVKNISLTDGCLPNIDLLFDTVILKTTICGVDVQHL